MIYSQESTNVLRMSFTVSCSFSEPARGNAMVKTPNVYVGSTCNSQDATFFAIASDFKSQSLPMLHGSTQHSSARNTGRISRVYVLFQPILSNKKIAGI